jgi:hypothetical protein
LQLIENEQHRRAGCSLFRRRKLPLGFDPCGIERHGAVSGGVDGGDADGVLNLAGDGGFPHLPGADNGMDDRYRPGKMVKEACL